MNVSIPNYEIPDQGIPIITKSNPIPDLSLKLRAIAFAFIIKTFLTADATLLSVEPNGVGQDRQ
jgi:hypothetical protein